MLVVGHMQQMNCSRYAIILVHDELLSDVATIKTKKLVKIHRKVANS